MRCKHRVPQLPKNNKFTLSQTIIVIETEEVYGWPSFDAAEETQS